MAVLSMSKQEFSRLDVLLRVQSGRLRVADAYARMGLHRRQVWAQAGWRSKLAVEPARPTEQSSASRRLFVESMMPSHHIGWSMGIHSSVIYMGTFLAFFDQSSHDYNYLQ
jgi:hypothetical protein